MKISTNLSNIQTMMRDSMEEVLISFPYHNNRFTRFFRKVLDCSRMSALVRAGGKNLLRNSFRMSSQVKIEFGASE